MADPTALELYRIAALIAPHLPPSLGSMEIAPIATGKHNRSFWVHAGPERFVLRVAPPDDTGLLFYERLMMRQEPDLHTLVRASTSIPVAEVVAADFSRERIDRDFILLRALPGRPMSDARPGRAERARALREVGGYLRQLHELTAPACLGMDAYGYLGPHRPMPPQPTWEAAFAHMWNGLLDDVAASGCYTASEAQAWRDLFERHRAHFARPVASRLLHMDVWSQNILVDRDGSVTGLVDFDRALWGDPEIELAVLDYCGISEPPFWQGYGMPRDASPSAEIRRQFYLLYEVQKYMPICVWRRGDLAAALEYKRQCVALGAGLGLGPA